MAGPWEQYQEAAPADGPWTKYANEPAAPQKPIGIRGEGFDKAMSYTGADQTGGFLRGTGSVGTTLARPFESKQSNDDRRANLDSSISQLTGADPESMGYKTNKLGAEIMGTAGIGGALAGVLGKIPALAKYAGPLLDSIGSAGMSAKGAGGVGGAVSRAAGGAINGGLSAGAINPDDAGVGALIGGAIPATAQIGGGMGNFVRSKMANESPANVAQKFAAAQAGAKAGYVVPPADMQPGITTELLSGLSGKIKTAQVASQRNQSVTDDLARKALGMGAGDTMTVDTLQAIRNQAAQAYAPVKAAGMVKADATFAKALDGIEQSYKGANSAFPGLAKDEVGQLVSSLRVGEFDAGGAVDAIKVLREQADKAFRAGDKGLGKATKEAATAVESQLERHLTAMGDTEALKSLREARQLIAKTYTVQKGLNPQTGNVSAQELAKQLTKGKPLTDELLTIAQMGQAFPKATQSLKETPKAFSPLDWAAAGGASMAASNPLPMAAMLARPAARSYLLSAPAQRAAMKMPGLLSSPEELSLLKQGLYRSAPALLSD